jgi:hypothetical protein
MSGLDLDLLRTLEYVQVMSGLCPSGSGHDFKTVLKFWNGN